MAVCVKNSPQSLHTTPIFWYKAQPFFKVVVFPMLSFGKYHLKIEGTNSFN